ncbi:MAG: STAS domain-containing protein [Acidobacteriota bacterium]
MGSTDNLSVTVSDGDPVTVKAAGQIDTYTAVALDETLLGVGEQRTLTIDLSGVTFIDSSGLRVLVRADKRHQTGGGSLRLANPSQPVVRLLQITGLESTLTIVT